MDHGQSQNGRTAPGAEEGQSEDSVEDGTAMTNRNQEKKERNRSRYGCHGELPYDRLDPLPVAMPVGYDRPPSMQELFAKYLHEEKMRESLANEGPETWEEANDFEEEDPEALDFSPYELSDLQEEMETGYNPDQEPQEATKPLEPIPSTPEAEKSPDGRARALTDDENRSPDRNQGEPSEASR